MINNKSILITGGTGSFGKKFIELVLKNFKPKRIIVYSRDEQKQFQLQQKWTNIKLASKIRYFIGDVRDLARLNLAMKGVDIVIHAAALKHVPIAEYNPFEAVKTNVLGAQNIIDACLENKVSKVIALSTDKASSPVNLYGATKLTSDKLFVAANNYSGPRKIKFSVVRYGNVMGSRGSVIPIFLKNKKAKFIPITDKKMTRFNITIEQGVKFVLFSLKKMLGGEVFIPKIPSYKITDLAKAIAPNTKIKVTGIRPGEKFHEELISISDSINSIEYKTYFVITPNSMFLDRPKEKYMKLNKGGRYCSRNFFYSSDINKEFLNVKQLQKLIKSHLYDFE